MKIWLVKMTKHGVEDDKIVTLGRNVIVLAPTLTMAEMLVQRAIRPGHTLEGYDFEPILPLEIPVSESEKVIAEVDWHPDLFISVFNEDREE